MKTVFRLLGVALFVVTLTSCDPQSSPEGVVKEYLSLTQKNEIKKAIDLVYFKQEMSEEDKAQLVSLVEEKAASNKGENGETVSFEITGTELDADGNSGVVRYVSKYEDGSTKENSEKVVKIDGKWWINSGK